MARAACYRRSMRHFLIAFALVLTVGAGVAVATSSSGDGDSGSEPRAESKPVSAERIASREGPRSRGHRGLGNGMFRMVVKQVLASSAGRLGVTEKQLRDALHVVGKSAKERRFAAAKLTAADRAALKACRGGHNRGGHRGFDRGRDHRDDRGARSSRRRGATADCDRKAARGALRKLKASKKNVDLAAEKQALANDLAKELKLEPAKVIEAARAELVERLGQAVGLGFVSEKGRTLALGCFDAPASCDVKALHAEVKIPGHGGMRRGHG